MRADIVSLEARLARAVPAGDAQIKIGAPKPAAAHDTHESGGHEQAAHAAPGEAH